MTSGVYSYFLFLLSAVWPWGRKAMDTCRTMWKRISPTDSLDCDLSLAINFTELNCWSFFVICYSSSLINKIRYMSAAAAAKLLQSCPTLCDPIDSSLLGSSVPGILQARILEWVAISFSSAWKWKVKVKLLSRADSLQPHELQHARPPCPSPTPGVHSNSRPSSQWCHPAISSSCRPLLLLPPIPPSIKVVSLVVRLIKISFIYNQE